MDRRNGGSDTRYRISLCCEESENIAPPFAQPQQREYHVDNARIQSRTFTPNSSTEQRCCLILPSSATQERESRGVMVNLHIVEIVASRSAQATIDMTLGARDESRYRLVISNGALHKLAL